MNIINTRNNIAVIENRAMNELCSGKENLAKS